MFTYFLFLLKYMENIRLKMLGLPIILTIGDFANQTNLSEYTIYQLSSNSDKYYFDYEIPKKNGKTRQISQPSKKLKGLQSWILFNILNKLKVSDSSKGFEIGKSISDNASPHANCNTLLNIDLKDFFPSIGRIKTYNVFRSIGYNNLISTVLTNICTHNNSLPQGGPCSPKIANLVCWNLDVRIQGYVGKKGIIYTRYADDMTFSGSMPSKVISILPIVNKIILTEGFNINKSKTRLLGISRRKEVTGLIISNGTYGIGREKYRLMRAKIFQLSKSGDNITEKEINHLIGWLSYIKSVDNERYELIKKYIYSLGEKYKDTSIFSQLIS